MQIDSNKVNGVSHPMGIRRNFFEQIERDLDLRAEYQKIETAVCSEQYGRGTLNSIISDSFMLWPKRDTFMSFKELRDHLGFPVSRQSGTPFFTAAENLSLAKFFTYCEMIENLIVDLNLTSVMCNEMLSGPDVVEKVRSVIRLDIAKANCEFKPIDRGMIICEKNPGQPPSLKLSRKISPIASSNIIIICSKETCSVKKRFCWRWAPILNLNDRNLNDSANKW